MGAVGEQGDVDDLVFDTGAAAVVAPQGKTTQGRGRASGRRSATGTASPTGGLSPRRTRPCRSPAPNPGSGRCRDATARSGPAIGRAGGGSERLGRERTPNRRFPARAITGLERRDASSVPKIFLFVVDLVPTEQFHELLLKSLCRVMLTLRLDVLDHSRDVRLADRECSIAVLPREGTQV